MASDDCAFCDIVRGDAEAARVLEDRDFVAFLDRRPLFHGHCLLVPRRHVETLPDLPEELVGPLFLRVRRVAAALGPALGAEGSFVALNNRVSQSVPHLHVHVVPRRRRDGLRGFFWPRTKYDSADRMQSVAARLREALEAPQAGG